MPHNGNTQPRISINTDFVSRRMEGGTASLDARLAAIHKLALPRKAGGGAYEVGLVIAPIMPLPDWEEQYTGLLYKLGQALDFECEVTFELISHRFTPGSKTILQEWYPNTQVDFDESNRSLKFNKYGGKKYVYPGLTMKRFRGFFESELKKRFPKAPILYCI